MSYCRWSSDSFKSDLYVYAHVDGFYSINIADNRLVGDNRPEELPTQNMTQDEWDAYFAAHTAALMKWLDTAAHEKIDLPYAGESFAEASAADAVDRLKMLQSLGYNVPQYAIEALEEERDNPTPDPECEVLYCTERPVAGGPWMEGGPYLSLCREHFRESRAGVPQPAIKPEALLREAQRDPETGFLPVQE